MVEPGYYAETVSGAVGLAHRTAAPIRAWGTALTNAVPSHAIATLPGAAARTFAVPGAHPYSPYSADGVYPALYPAISMGRQAYAAANPQAVDVIQGDRLNSGQTVRARRKKKKNMMLPPGWRMVERSSAKCKYKTYVSPQGKSFRSMAGVHRYLAKQQAQAATIAPGHYGAAPFVGNPAVITYPAHKFDPKMNDQARLIAEAEEGQKELIELKLDLMQESANMKGRADDKEIPDEEEDDDEDPEGPTTILLTHIACLKQYSYPEGSHEQALLDSPHRLRQVLRALAGANESRLRNLEWLSVPSYASLDDIYLAHSREYINSLLSLCNMVEKGTFTSISMDPPFNDTIVSRGTRDAIMYAAGATTAAVDAVLLGHSQNVFCAVRPPGHLASQSKPSGSCILNNVAIAAMHARRVHMLNKIAVVDLGANLGDGTAQALVTLLVSHIRLAVRNVALSMKTCNVCNQLEFSLHIDILTGRGP